MRELLFSDALEAELRARKVPYDRGEVLQFVEDIWANVKTHPDVRVWADHFINTPVTVTP